VAERILHDLKEEENLKRYQIAEFNPEITFQTIADRFIARGTNFFNRDRLKHFLSFFGPMKVSAITRNRAAEYRTERRTITPSLTEAGVIADVRKAIMGHEDGSAHGVYTHVELPTKREAILKLERWVQAERNRATQPQINYLLVQSEKPSGPKYPGPLGALLF
jgi:hypothetical protein